VTVKSDERIKLAKLRPGALTSEVHKPATFERVRHPPYMVAKEKVVITGCTLCRKHFETVEQFKRHITEDVLPPLLDKLSVRNGECQNSNTSTQYSAHKRASASSE
jgi:hypothetical protein